MAVRVVNGNTSTEDGWPLVDQAGCTWITVPGTNPKVTIQVQTGIPAVLLGAWEADWNAYIEPLEDPTTGCWTEGNSVLGQPGENNGSNHLGGTAVDSCWERHPMGPEAPSAASGFSQAQYDEMQRMKAYYTFTAKDGRVIQLVWWANDWDTPHDSMHSQMGYYTYQYRGEVQDWINTHIRADDFSTYRRGNAPPPPIGLTARNLSDAMGGAVSLDRYAQLLPGYRAACVEAGLSGNLNRLAMFAAQLGEESGGLKWMEEIASGSEYEGRSDLGNTQPGDGVRFKGRGPIQITGRNNYSQLSQWAFGKGYVPSPTFFVDNPTQLSTDQYGFLGPVWYWTVARPQINSLCDAGDIVGVTKAINGGTNGLQDRTNRWNHCLAMGLAQLDVQGTTGPTPDTGDDDLSAEAERMIKELYDEYRKEKTGPSRSFMVPDGNPVDSPLGFLWNIDGNVENINITLGYLFGTTLAEEFVNTVASTGVAPASWAGNVNRAWLQQYGQQWCLGLIDFRAAIQTALQSAGAVPVVNNAAPTIVTASITPAQAQDIANRIGQQIAIPATPPAATVPAVVDSPAGLGDIVKTVVDAVEQLKLSDALSTQDYATLAASIKILEMKNGTA